MRLFPTLLLSVSTAVLVGLIASSICSAAPPNRSNIVVIIADDLGYGETGMMGATDIPTPAIDALAASGVRCTSGYVTSSYCSGSRAGLFTGRFQSRFGYDMNPTGKRNLHPEAGLPETATTFVRHLADANYRTGLIGKWHLGTVETKVPTKRGFDQFFGFLHEGHYYVPHANTSDELKQYPGVLTMLRDNTLEPGTRLRSGDLIRGNYAPISEPDYDGHNPLLVAQQGGSQKVTVEPDYLTDAITDNAVDFIDRNSDAPFCLVVAYSAVHSPMQGLHADLQQLSHIEDDQRRIFAAMLVAMDRGVGAITNALAENEITENTLVIFLSDNGGPTAELTSSNAPLRAGKGTLYEGGIRVPMVWSMPGTIPQGVTEGRIVISVDIAATAMKLAGLPVPTNMDGQYLIDRIGQAETEPMHDEVYWRMSNGRTAYRWKDWKIIRPKSKQALELYNLLDDPAEQHDLAQANPAVFRKIANRWKQLDLQMAKPIRLPK